MAQGESITRKAGRRPAFDADDVIDAAFAEGLDRFTLAAVAERLSVVPPALYRLFRSRDEVEAACLRRAASTIEVPAPGARWEDVLRLWAEQCWLVCERHRGLNRMVYANPVAFTHVEHITAAYARALIADGWTVGEAAFALDFLGDTVFVSHLGIEAMHALDEEGESGYDRARRESSDDAVFRPQPQWLDRTVLDAKIEFIIEGLQHRRPDM
ncbi:hypothetical protein GCM10027289_17230 [Tsukamurella serpentis]